MSQRYIQSAVSNEDHKAFSIFAKEEDLTLSELIETAVKYYITKRKEEKGEVKKNSET